MVFSSITFLFLFLPIFLIGYFLIRKEYKNLFLLLSSLVFYFWGEGRYTIVIIISMLGNYLFGLLIDKFRIESTPKSDKLARMALIAALIFNFGGLIFFKYYNFIIANINEILSIAIPYQIANPSIHLPIGISFFTFQAVSYLMDVYRRDIPAQKSAVDYSLYISLFPQLIAGPIVRYIDISKEISNRVVSTRQFYDGIERFIFGLSKKVLIANQAGFIADSIFKLNSQDLSFGLAWLGVISYAIQIFFDFSGYSDMAIGIGKMIGFNFLENFNYPYISKSIKEFWRRWHISLSTWFRDYLYIPLGGNRKGPFRTYFNLVFVFFVCGLWHGASWTFVIWGLWLGAFLIIERTPFGSLLEKSYPFIRHFYTLLVILIGWVFFRSESMTQASVFLQNMFFINGLKPVDFSPYLNSRTILALTFGIIVSIPVFKWLSHFYRNAAVFQNRMIHTVGKVLYKTLLVFLFVLSSASISSGTFNPFIYFRF